MIVNPYTVVAGMLFSLNAAIWLRVFDVIDGRWHMVAVFAAGMVLTIPLARALRNEIST